MSPKSCLRVGNGSSRVPAELLRVWGLRESPAPALAPCVAPCVAPAPRRLFSSRTAPQLCSAPGGAAQGGPGETRGGETAPALPRREARGALGCPREGPPTSPPQVHSRMLPKSVFFPPTSCGSEHERVEKKGTTPLCPQQTPWCSCWDPPPGQVWGPPGLHWALGAPQNPSHAPHQCDSLNSPFPARRQGWKRWAGLEAAQWAPVFPGWGATGREGPHGEDAALAALVMGAGESGSEEAKLTTDQTYSPKTSYGKKISKEKRNFKRK